MYFVAVPLCFSSKKKIGKNRREKSYNLTTKKIYIYTYIFKKKNIHGNTPVMLLLTREKQGQAGTKQGQADTKQGQAGTKQGQTRKKRGQQGPNRAIHGKSKENRSP